MRLTVVLASCFAALGLAACGGSAATSGPTPSQSRIEHARLTIDGRERTYTTVRPATVDPKRAAPAVVALHPFGTDGKWMEAHTGLDERAKADGFIVAYPDGFHQTWNAGSCCGDAQDLNVDDVAFIRQLIDRLTRDLRVDPKRLFVTGLSNGAMLAYRLACELSDRITGIASVAGTMAIPDCRPARPLPVLEIHGTGDAILPYDGRADPGDTVRSVDSVIRGWATIDGCTGNPTQSASGITKTSAWETCSGGMVVRLVTVIGGHHRWFGPDDPEIQQESAPVAGEPNASVAVWNFFRSLSA